MDDWATAPVRTGWSTKAMGYGRLASGTLDSTGVSGAAPSTEEGQVFMFEARIPDEEGSSGWWLAAEGPAVIKGGAYEFRGSFGLDMGRCLKEDGPTREFRVVARELRVSEEDKRHPFLLKTASEDPDNYLGDSFVAGKGTTKLWRDLS